MKTIQEFINAGILIQSDIDNEYISQANIDKYNSMSDEELKDELVGGVRFMEDDYHTFYHPYNQIGGLREMSDDEFVYRNGIAYLHTEVVKQILEERNVIVETALKDTTYNVYLHEHEGDEEYFKELDEQYARIGTVIAEG